MALKLGAVSSLKKPFKPADVRAAVAHCLPEINSGSANSN